MLLRLVWGDALTAHGIPKLKNPRHWMENQEAPALPSLLEALEALT